MTVSAGAFALKRTGKTDYAIADEVGVTHQAVTKWRNQTSKPSRVTARPKLHALYGIPPKAWDEPHGAAPIVPDLETSGTAPSKPALRSPRARKGGSVPDLDVPRTLVVVPDSIEGRIELVERMLRRLLEKADKETDAAPLESAKLLAAATTTLHKLAAMKGELDITRRVLTLPAFKRAVQLITEACRPWPDAAAAIAAALRVAESE